jgi:hypothetical protein
MAIAAMTNGATQTLPEEVTLHSREIANPRFTPRELKLIKQHTGASFSKLLGDEDSDEKFVVFGWLKLRRMGYDPAWEAMEDVVLSFDMADAAVDPTNAPPRITSPSSAGTGA